MSAYGQELSKITVQKWRNFSTDGAFSEGITHLRMMHAPRLDGATAVEKFESAVAWQAYMRALADVENVLTAFPFVEKSIDEPPLETIDPRS